MCPVTLPTTLASRRLSLAHVLPTTLGRGNPIVRNATPGHIEHTDRKTPRVRVAANLLGLVLDEVQGGP